MEENTQKNTQKKESPFAFIRSVLLTVFVTWFVLNFIIINANIPSGSMENTIMTGDRVIGIRLIKDYNRGDIVIFPDPEQEGRYLIKRVIGLPGEKLEISQGADGFAEVYINGSKLSEDYLAEPMLYTGDQEFEVPEDCYFMLGDNRNNSEDARYWNDPYIPEDRMLAKVYFRYWPGIKWLDE